MDSAQKNPCREHRLGLMSRLAIAAVGALGMAACSPYSPSSETTATPSAATTSPQPGAAMTPVAASEFVFPQNSCGDRVSDPSTTWYPVYLDGANIEEVRTKYCRDAVSTIRAISGQPSVQVASFTSYDKALRFAKIVGGEVEQLGNSLAAAPGQASPSTTAMQPSGVPSASPSLPGATTTQPSSSLSTTTARSASLTAQDSDSPINVRASASTSSEVKHVGYPGDRVRITGQSQGDDGYTWYSVQFESGQTGWVRSDFTSGGSTAARPSTTTTGPSAARPSTLGSPSASSGASAMSGRRASLTAAEPDAAINVRDGAGMSAGVRDVAYSGDAVRILGQEQGDDGNTWYNVQFESGQTGWVRSDFVSQN